MKRSSSLLSFLSVLSLFAALFVASPAVVIAGTVTPITYSLSYGLHESTLQRQTLGFPTAVAYFQGAADCYTLLSYDLNAGQPITLNGLFAWSSNASSLQTEFSIYPLTFAYFQGFIDTYAILIGNLNAGIVIVP